MTTRILAALAAACLTTPAMARSVEPFGPVCDLPLAVMRKMPTDAIAVMLEGDEAARMLTAIARVTHRPSSTPRRS